MRLSRRSTLAVLFACSLTAGCGGVTNNRGVIGCYNEACLPATPVPTPTPSPTPAVAVATPTPVPVVRVATPTPTPSPSAAAT